MLRKYQLGIPSWILTSTESATYSAQACIKNATQKTHFLSNGLIINAQVIFNSSTVWEHTYRFRVSLKTHESCLMFVIALMGFLIKECGLNGEKCGCSRTTKHIQAHPSIFHCLMNWSRLQCLIKWRIVVNSILECILTICKLTSNAIWTFIFSVNGFFSSFFAKGLSRLSNDAACLIRSHSNKRHLPSVETNNHVPPRKIRCELKRTSPQNPQIHKHRIFRIHSTAMSCREL